MQSLQITHNTKYLLTQLIIEISRVLIIYTGGTIGMKPNADNHYEPVSNYLGESLRSMVRFHDPYNPQYSPKTLDSLSRVDSQIHLNNLSEQIQHNPQLQSATQQQLLNQTNWLITPPSLYGKRIKYSIKEYDPLLDSCNMGMDDWVKIATDIQDNYKLYDAFLVLHGTDTMAYTASALSFMLENLGKTVIITGSQVPLSEVRNDAVENLLGALTIAGHFVIPEVCLYFNNSLFRGNRCSKISAIDFHAFDSPNCRPLAETGVNIEVNWGEVFFPRDINKFTVSKKMNSNVASLRLFPGITDATVKAFLSTNVEGVILETYGAGNTPDRPELMKALAEASNRGVVIVNCTQCRKGSVSSLYATAKGLIDANVVPGGDMTPECYTPEKVRELMQTNLRGELTEPKKTLPVFPDKPLDSTESSSCLHYLFHCLPQPLSLFKIDDLSKMQINQMSRSLLPLILCSAASAGDVDTIRHLNHDLGSQLQFNITDYSGNTPLHVACSNGEIEVVKYLLLNGASVHLQNARGHTPIFESIMAGHLDIVQLLRQAGGHLNLSELKFATLQFFNASNTGQLQQLQLFLEAGIEVNSQGVFGSTALHFAVEGQQPRVISFLLTEPEFSFLLSPDTSSLVSSSSPSFSPSSSSSSLRLGYLYH
ncbi:asparaginase-domain-containing protein [Conidiobolus coronatus NRRL 28638]|uniref:asparaginase n=1 Tax=Conidiobolus coronatus (strain ATCC 28846 / CBS 209.66 / NRRL 28638) TaxID=796925 RepID=A0A137PAW2_CONC2|nr:asparaginase-domain-containing protein [Conidiobolus coronatus NRRL 28638]|eukprot:KXN72158.1 asparaginase-domain-containing protein [Conidiobolus coronatus NRRL 28638]